MFRTRPRSIDKRWLLRHHGGTTKPPTGRTPCVTPGSKLWIDYKDRWAVPAEKMALQGMGPERATFASVSPTVVSDLAGNAVSVPVAAAMTIAILTGFIDVLATQARSEDST
eukprot:4152211-Alexandrium_andersonii.AAC.1